MTPDQIQAKVTAQFSDHINPYLGKLMNFAGFGVEDHAEGCYIWDHEGNRYLDCLGGYGVFSVGHRNPRVVAAVKAQLEKMPLGSKVFFSSQATALATKLAEITPEGLEYTFFSNSGTEAVEAALKFARASSGRPNFVSTHGGYHGKTLGALAVTGREKYQKRFQPLMPGAKFVDYGDIDQAVSAMDDQTAAFIVETLQGEGGIIVPPAGYMKALREACTAKGVLLIADEVQTGLGRTGKMFGCDHESVAPDILTLAKALGGGVMPIGATMVTKSVIDSMYSENPLLHTSTFGGNPLACVAGLATIQVIEEEGLVERSEKMGALMREHLGAVREKHPDLVAEVRGKGLMIGVEFTMDEVGELTIAQMTKRGLIAAYTLNNPKVIRFEPPLIINEAEVEDAARIFGEAVAETAELLASLV